jgi:hypothetical protein
MHMFLVYLSTYFGLTCFGLSFRPSSEAGVQLRQWLKSAGYGVSARALTPCADTIPSRLELVHYVGHYTISFQNARSLQHKIWIKVVQNRATVIGF